MVRLEYFNGKEWILIQEWPNAEIAWCTLGGDTFNYRVVDEKGNVFPLSYGFSDNFHIGNICEIKKGKDIFKDFIRHKGHALYNLFGQTFHAIELDTETDMITWTEMVVNQSKKKQQPIPQF